MEINNEAAALIVQKEYAEGMERLQIGLRQVQAHLAQMPQVSRCNSSDINSDSLDTWMYPATEACRIGHGFDPTASFFVYQRPLVVPSLSIGRARTNAETSNFITGAHTNLLVAMLFNYGLACHLSHIDHERRLGEGSRSHCDLLERASRMYDSAIVTLRRVGATESNASRTLVSSNIEFFRAAINNLAITEQTRSILESSRNEEIPFNKGFERLRELLLRNPPQSVDAPGRTLWRCYVSNIMRVINSSEPNHCAAAC
ncbi:unnamed protein product [Cylindrotheca closterium]|uniref:Uncharacterized protein n=1 Tax=Cylindrotheca closterium TaxID=2856 RepID=A0AAD2CMH4_9STRA|nr:unnamed protein product [Cylindrotheca closterium]